MTSSLFVSAIFVGEQEFWQILSRVAEAKRKGLQLALEPLNGRGIAGYVPKPELWTRPWWTASRENSHVVSALRVLGDVEAFTLGCFMAGLGGAIIVPSQSAVLGMGVDALVLSFIVVVIGGLGSLEGALVGAIIVGFVREAGITWFAEIELAVLYLIAALVLLVRPAGLFGRP